MVIQCPVCKRFLIAGLWIHYKVSDKRRKESASRSICPRCSIAMARGCDFSARGNLKQA